MSDVNRDRPPNMANVNPPKEIAVRTDELLARLGLRPTWRRYGLAVLSSTAAVALTLVSATYFERTIFLLVFIAVGVSAWYGGLGPGLVAAFVGLLAIDYWLVPGVGFKPLDPRDIVPLVLFVLVAALLSALSSSLRTARAKAEHREQEAIELSQQLQDQTVELEQQVEEMQALNEELEQQTGLATRLAQDLEGANRRLAARAREQLEEAQQIAHVGSWEWNVADGTVTWSDEMCRIYGLEPGMAVSYQRFLSMIHPEDRTQLQACVERALAERGSFAVEHRIVRPDGVVRRLAGRGRAIADESGAVTSMVGTGQDITEQREMELAARRTLEAEAANAAKMQFLTMMSHELRTPLNAIAGYAELLALGVRGPVTGEQREDLSRIQRNQKHLLGVINDILNFARIESGHVQYDLRDVPVNATLSAVEQLLAPQIRAKRIDFRFEPAPEELFARADREKMLQVVLNLLSNAIKFTHPGGRIRMDARQRDGAIALRVHDTGIGIPTDKLESIFDPFVQVSGSYTRTAEGTGLGLAISRDLARAMGGEIVAESEVGGGSMFTVTLPLAARESGVGSRD